MEPTTIKSADGISIAVQEWGNPKGREILFIHGFNQSHLSWQRQVIDPALAGEFRMVTFDLRGHGSSGKPINRDAYIADKLWADDVAAVIETHRAQKARTGRLVLRRPHHFGLFAQPWRCRLAGINYVGARTVNNSTMFGPGRVHFAKMISEDLATNIEGTRGFLRVVL